MRQIVYILFIFAAQNTHRIASLAFHRRVWYNEKKHFLESESQMSLTNTEKKEFDFFISYSNADTAVIEPIVRTMKREFRAKCWFQLDDSRKEYVDEITRGIENASVFLIFISRHSAMSNNVLNEVHYALGWADSHPEYIVLPIVLDDGNFNIDAEECRKIRFYLNRFNMLFYRKENDVNELIFQIFSQTNFKAEDDSPKESFYHSSDVEAKRLKAQNEILVKSSNDIFAELVTPSSVILDVGCAAGANIMLRLEGLPYRKLLGIDIDPAQLARAEEQFGNEKNTFRECDITTDALYDVLQEFLDDADASGFDVIHVSALLLHITEPVKLLKALKRYLRSSGYLFIQDEDDGANIVHPYTTFFERAFAIWADSKESGDRHCARKIPAYLAEAGYKHVSLKKCGISNIDLSPEEQSPFWDIYFNHYLWDGLERKLFYNPKKTLPMADDYIAEYEQRFAEYMNGEIFIQLGFLFFVAQK